MSELIWLVDELTIEKRRTQQRILSYADRTRSYGVCTSCATVSSVDEGVKNSIYNDFTLFLQYDRNDCAHFVDAVSTAREYGGGILEAPLRIVCSTCRNPEYGDRDHWCFIERVSCTLEGYTYDKEAIIKCAVLEW